MLTFFYRSEGEEPGAIDLVLEFDNKETCGMFMDHAFAREEDFPSGEFLHAALGDEIVAFTEERSNPANLRISDLPLREYDPISWENYDEAFESAQQFLYTASIEPHLRQFNENLATCAETKRIDKSFTAENIRDIVHEIDAHIRTG